MLRYDPGVTSMHDMTETEAIAILKARTNRLKQLAKLQAECSSDRREAILALHKSGWSIGAIAALIDVSKSAIAKQLYS